MEKSNFPSTIPVRVGRSVCLPPSETLVWMRGPSGSTVQPPPAAVLNCPSVRHHFLWPGDLPLTCPGPRPGLQLVLLESGCVPVVVNETVDAKNSTEPWLRHGGFTCHCDAIGLFTSWAKGIIYHSPNSRYATKLHHHRKLWLHICSFFFFFNPFIFCDVSN